MIRITTMAAILLLGTGDLAMAQSGTEPSAAMKMDHGTGHAMGGMPAGTAHAADTPSSRAYMRAMSDMDAGMATPMTGNADIDFMRGMLAHHEGAIAMAKVELEFGKDPQARALAETIIKAQEAEITVMKAWLAKNGS